MRGRGGAGIDGDRAGPAVAGEPRDGAGRRSGGPRGGGGAGDDRRRRRGDPDRPDRTRIIRNCRLGGDRGGTAGGRSARRRRTGRGRRTGPGPRPIAATWRRSSPAAAVRRRRCRRRSGSRAGSPRSRRHGHRRAGRRPPRRVGQLRHLHRPRRAGPRRRGPGRLLGDEVDPRPAGDPRVARDARRPGRRLPHRRAARIPGPLVRPGAGAPRRFPRRGRGAGADAPIARAPRRHRAGSARPRAGGHGPRSAGPGTRAGPRRGPTPGDRRQAADAVPARGHPPGHRRPQPPRNCALLVANARLAALVAVEVAARCAPGGGIALCRCARSASGRPARRDRGGR